MNAPKLNLIRWLLLFLSLFLISSLPFAIDVEDTGILKWIMLILWIISTILLIILFIYKRDTIKKGLKWLLITLIPVSIISLVLSGHFIEDTNLNENVSVIFIYTLILSVLLSFIVYLLDAYVRKIEAINFGLIALVLAGFILNRFGLILGRVIILFAFGLASIGFCILVYKSIISYRENRKAGGILITLYCALAILNALFFLKFMVFMPVFTNIYDTIGVVVTIFIVLPFSNFIEWAQSQKKTFVRLIIFPLILFLLIFSLKFLLPDTTYRKIFFKEYSEQGKVYFNMKDNEIDFTKR
jgi:hypothetical protein